MKKYGLIAALVVAAILVTSCTEHHVKQGTLRDTLFSVEETENGAWRVFVTHDDVAGYCTADEDIGRRAAGLLQTHKGEVLLGFRDIKALAGDPEFSWWDRSDCGTLVTGTDSSMKMFLLYSIEPVDAR